MCCFVVAAAPVAIPYAAIVVVIVVERTFTELARKKRFQKKENQKENLYISPKQKNQ